MNLSDRLNISLKNETNSDKNILNKIEKFKKPLEKIMDKPQKKEDSMFYKFLQTF